MKNILILLFLLAFSNAEAQQAIGSWREHLPYNRGKVVADAGSRIYCSTDDALFGYVKEDGTLERYSKLNGLNDFGISTTAYSSEYHTLIICYSNSNIDLLTDDQQVYNLSFIKDKNITGLKNINNIYIKGKLAYLACGFGVVVVDVQKQEIKDTYYIGPGGKNMNVLDIADDGNYIYAGTDTGIYRAPLNGPDLADFNNWSQVLSDNDAVNTGDFNILKYFGGTLYANLAKPGSAITFSDELWKLENGIWIPVNDPNFPGWPKRYSMKVINDELLVSNANSVSIFNTGLSRVAYFDESFYSNVEMRDAVKEANGITWIADHRKGLVKIENNTVSVITPAGPTSAYAADIAIENDRLWVAHGPKSTSWNPQDYPLDGFSTFKDGTWQSWNYLNLPSLQSNNFFSNMSLAIVPGNTEHVRIGSTTSGILDFNGVASISYYNNNNSTLEPMVGNPTQTKAHGMVHDENGNLWVVNSGVPDIIKVFKNDGAWRSFNMGGVINGAPFAGYIIIDESNFKWVNLFGGIGTTDVGLLVLDDAGTIDDASDDRKRFVALPDAAGPRCMALDADGQLWVGTDAGLRVIYSPSSAFDGDVTPQQILIKQDDTYQYLLETEIVTYIAIDGANRKWVGTANSGVYLFSTDGQQEIHHFTAENSPLFSNNITCIAINKSSGEVFLGTDKGMISYQGDAIEGGEECATVLVYPNPVRPNYNGPIAVKGVMNNARIKITDISGTLVFQGNALGGQAIWNGRNLKGEKANTGVYLVFASDDAGENACITKLLFVK